MSSQDLPVERPEDCITRVLYSGTAGFVIGGFAGGVAANWTEVPLVLRNQSMLALQRTAKIMGQYGATFALIGVTYSGVDCAVETLRGKKDMWNGVAGGVASGAMMGLRIGRMSSAVAAAFAMAAMSAIVDINEGHLVGRGAIDDGQTPKRLIYPYPKSAERGTA